LNVSESEKARDAAYRFLSYRSRSTVEVERKLREKGFDEAIVRKTIERLRELNFLDDESFARSLARDLARVKGYGKNQVEKRLKSKGIEGDILVDTIETVFSEIDELEAATGLAIKKAKGPLDSLKDKARMGRYLYGRGYSWEIIKEVLKGFDDRERNQE